MKKMLRYCAGPAYYGMYSSRRLPVQKQTGNPVAQRKLYHHHFFVSGNWVEKKTVSMQPKFVAAQKMLLKQKPANIRKWIARFYYFKEHLYSTLEARVYCSQ